MRLPITDVENRASINQTLVNEMVDYFLDRGFTYFDTAYPYHQGMSEVAARKALVERRPRESFTLTNKMPTFLVTGSEDYQRYFDEQIERCGVEFFDYYLLHNLGAKNDANTLKHGGFEFVSKLKAEGKVRHLGFSFHDKAELLDRILTDHPEMEYVQLQINYIDWDNDSIESRKCYEVATKHGKPVIVMEPVKGGSLAHLPEEAEKLFKACRPDMSMVSWAVRFAASLDNAFVVLSGMSSLEQVVDNTSYMQEMASLSDDENEAIGKAVEIINSSSAIPCTACQYCVDGCPQEIPIPKYFALYNNQERFGLTAAHANYYMNLNQDSGKASDCIECGQCEQSCPQHIDIIEQLTKVATVFDAAVW
jgi:hypothetical protein